MQIVSFKLHCDSCHHEGILLLFLSPLWSASSGPYLWDLQMAYGLWSGFPLEETEDEANKLCARVVIVDDLHWGHRGHCLEFVHCRGLMFFSSEARLKAVGVAGAYSQTDQQISILRGGQASEDVQHLNTFKNLIAHLRLIASWTSPAQFEFYFNPPGQQGGMQDWLKEPCESDTTR